MVKLKIGTRGSKLALWQTNHFKNQLEAAHAGLECEIVIIKTRGDAIQDRPLSEVGGKGLFVKELEEALLDGRVDLAVHSMKDMPAELPEGLILGCVPERVDPRDAWVRPAGAAPLSLDELPEGATVGTSSLRRAAQLLARRPDLNIIPLRGNVDTRLRKLDEGVDGLEAIILACAGLTRLGLEARITAPLDVDVMLPAVGQGALAIESREADPIVGPVLAALHDPTTAAATRAERAFLAAIEGSCKVPVAGHATLDGDEVTLTALVAGVAGAPVVTASASAPSAD
ncbi:MAG: hydroxymethylbilane synthase, partial [Deltaproteobacteria bacterium]